MADEKKIIQINCKGFREELGLSQQDAAHEASLSVDAIRAFEQGRRTPERDSLSKLAKLYGRTIDDFFNESPPPIKRERTRPLFALKVVNPAAPEDLRRRAEEHLQSLNREFFDNVQAAKAKKHDRGGPK